MAFKKGDPRIIIKGKDLPCSDCGCLVCLTPASYEIYIMES